MAAAAERRGPGLIRSLAGALLLGAVGFGLGLGVGASWEDPDLLVTALAGERRSLALPDPTPEARGAAPPPLGSAGGSETAPAAVSAPPSEASARSDAPPAAPPPPSAAGRVDASPPGSAAAPAAGFSVQVGAFSDRSAAGGLEQRLEEQGLPTFVTGAAGEENQRWRVRVGPVTTRDEAERLAGRLKREHGLPTWVVAHDD